MKLDSRIIDGKKPLDCFDAENKELIKPFLNKEGYFSNNLANYCFLNKCPKRFLSNVFNELRRCFTACINGGDGGDWKYFLPAEWVKEPEKKYRAFTLQEFKDKFKIGEIIRFRRKDDQIEYNFMFGGWIVISEDDSRIQLGDLRYPPEILFTNYELFYSDRYVPFGVEE